MKLSAPKTVVWLIAVIVALIGILSGIGIVTIPVLTPHAFWLVSGAFVLLALATLLKGL